MEYEIYDSEKVVPKKRHIIELILVKGRPTLVIVGTGGTKTAILKLNSFNRIERFRNVPEGLGFPLDEHGQVKGVQD